MAQHLWRRLPLLLSRRRGFLVRVSLFYRINVSRILCAIEESSTRIMIALVYMLYYALSGIIRVLRRRRRQRKRGQQDGEGEVRV